MQEYNFFLLPNKNKRFDKIPYSEITHLEGHINYTFIHLRSGKIKISPRTLRYHEIHSLNEEFLRIHRAFSVNKNYIQGFESEKNDYLLLIGGVRLSVSRRRKKCLDGIVVSPFKSIK